MDTDVIAAALLGEEGRGEEASALLASCRPAMAPSHWKAELANVVWKAVLLGRMPVEAIGPAIDAAARLPIQTVDVSDLWRGAVMRSVAARHPVYDVLFVELATREQTRVASYDRDLRKAFPGVVSTPGSLLAGSRRS